MKLLSVIESELNKLFIFELKDGFTVEAVHYRGDTLCVSTQVGCPIECGFCASGRNGLFRNLTFEEIVSQFEIVKENLPVKRIAVAGIGEPLLNWKNVREAFSYFKSKGLKVSFYTTGFPLKHLDELIDLPHNGVTISVHSLDEKVRKEIMPFAGSLKLLINFLKEKLKGLTKKKRSKISLAFLMLKGINDSEEHIRKIAKLAKELGVSVTLLYYNKVGSFEPVDEDEYEKAFLMLRNEGVRVTLSTRFRKDKIGGCGTLTVGRIDDETCGDRRRNGIIYAS